MRVFMDNMIPGTIFDLDYGYAEVRLKVMIGHAEVDATVPREQVTEMGLARGVQVLICFDASRVLFATDRGRITQIAGVNKLAGMVTKIECTPVRTRVCINLSGGQRVVGDIDEDELSYLGLSLNDTAVALIKPSEIFVVTA